MKRNIFLLLVFVCNGLELASLARDKDGGVSGISDRVMTQDEISKSKAFLANVHGKSPDLQKLDDVSSNISNLDRKLDGVDKKVQHTDMQLNDINKVLYGIEMAIKIIGTLASLGYIKASFKEGYQDFKNWRNPKPPKLVREDVEVAFYTCQAMNETKQKDKLGLPHVCHGVAKDYRAVFGVDEFHRQVAAYDRYNKMFPRRPNSENGDVCEHCDQP
jgi:hypothetical protein